MPVQADVLNDACIAADVGDGRLRDHQGEDDQSDDDVNRVER